jgi:hypothetical protein
MHKNLLHVITCNKYEYVINRGEYVITFLITCNMAVCNKGCNKGCNKERTPPLTAEHKLLHLFIVAVILLEDTDLASST